MNSVRESLPYHILRYEKLLVTFQGLFEYVKPSWQGPVRPTVKDFDMNKFGATLHSRPAISNIADKMEIQSNGVPTPR